MPELDCFASLAMTELAPEPRLQPQHGQRRLGRLAALVLLVRSGPGEGLGLVLDGEDAVADGEAVEGERHDPARALAGDDLEMIGLAADHDAQRNEGVE